MKRPLGFALPHRFALMVLLLASLVLAACGGQDLEESSLDSTSIEEGAPEITDSTSDTDVPTVSSVSPVDASTDVTTDVSVSVTFSEAMETDSITTNTSSTSCSGVLRLSSDSFSTCVKMSASPSASSDKKTFTITPAASLTNGTTYKFKVTKDANDAAGNDMTSDYSTSTGFTVVAATDSTAPTVGTSSLTISSVASTSLSISWTAATDNTDAASSLKYKVVYSTSDNISSSSTAASNGTTAMDYSAATTSASVTGLSSAKTYYFNVLVKDTAGNVSVYTSNSTTTGPSGALETNSTSLGLSLNVNQLAVTKYGTQKVMMVHADNNAPTKAYYDTWTTSAAISGSTTTLDSNDTSASNTAERMAAATLTSGKVLLAYPRDGTGGYFQIVDTGGSTTISNTAFSDTSNTTVHYIDAAALTGGGFVIAWANTYSIGPVYSNIFKIFTSDGTTSVNTTFLSTNQAKYIQVAPLSSGGFVLAYVDGGDSDAAKYRIYNSSGTLVTNGTIKSGTTVDHLAMDVNSSDYIFFGYRYGATNNAYQIINSSGSTIKTETSLRTGTVQYTTVTAASNGYFLVAYQTATNGSYQVFDSSGSSVQSETAFSSNASIAYVTSGLFSDNRIAIAFRDATTIYMSIVK